MYGQYAALEPERSKGRVGIIGKDCVGSAWVDALLPIMADSRNPEDKLWILAEPDLRFYFEDCSALEDYREAHGEPVASTIAVRQKVWGEVAKPTPELEDILKVRTVASRLRSKDYPNGLGEFIWMTWEPTIRGGDHGPYKIPRDKTRKTSVGTGNFLFAITTKAARKFMEVLADALAVHRHLHFANDCV